MSLTQTQSKTVTQEIGGLIISHLENEAINSQAVREKIYAFIVKNWGINDTMRALRCECDEFTELIKANLPTDGGDELEQALYQVDPDKGQIFHDIFLLTQKGLLKQANDKELQMLELLMENILRSVGLTDKEDMAVWKANGFYLLNPRLFVIFHDR